MSLGGWPERWIDAEVQLERSCVEPDTATSLEVFRLRYLYQPEDVSVESSRQRLAAWRNGDLHMVNVGYAQVQIPSVLQ